MTHRRAVIDVGTNSVKLLVADLEGDSVLPVTEGSVQTRLGRGFYDDHCLRREAIRQTAETVAEFARVARRASAGRIRVLATSAARDAVNRDDLVAAIHDRCGLVTEIISGDQEAEWAFRGVASDRRFHDRPVLLLEVGGGSTQFVQGTRGHPTSRQSFPIGSVRLLETLRPSDPPTEAEYASCRGWLADFLERQVSPALGHTLAGGFRDETRLVSTGGTATFLACLHHELAGFDRERIDSTVFSAGEVRRWTTRLWSLPLAKRQELRGLPPSRADVILTGLAIIDAVVTHFSFPRLFVSTRGLRFGAVLADG